MSEFSLRENSETDCQYMSEFFLWENSETDCQYDMSEFSLQENSEIDNMTYLVGTFYARPNTRKRIIKKCQREMVLIKS